MDEKIKKLEDRIEKLESKRAYQWDIVPGAVKNRHMAEPNSYVYSGLAADLPTDGASVTLGVSIYFATDTNTLYIWNGTAWKSEIFT